MVAAFARTPGASAPRSGERRDEIGRRHRRGGNFMNLEDAGKMSRRRLLQTSAGLALGAALGGETGGAEPSRPGIYETLGVKPVINATGTVTFLGGSLMPPEVV